MNPLSVSGDGVRLRVLVQPRASMTELAGLHGDALKVRLAAPPVDGEANEELIRLLAKTLGVKRGDVGIVSGSSSRRKVIEIRGVALTVAIRMLGL